MRQFIKGIEKDQETKGALVYDAIAAYYLINPKAFRCRLMDILIETKGEHTLGMTVVEKRKVKLQHRNIRVVVGFDRHRFVSDFMTILRYN